MDDWDKLTKLEPHEAQVTTCMEQRTENTISAS